MKILLDENLPEGLIEPLKALGHSVASVNTLGLKGIDNGTLYREFAPQYDVCFTKDKGFAQSVQNLPQAKSTKVLLVTLPQQPEEEFVRAFLISFGTTRWETLRNGDPWPSE
jgi:predicted nuclease of predicted toxin-antitoxin system